MVWRLKYVYTNFSCPFQRYPVLLSRSNVSWALSGFNLVDGHIFASKIGIFWQFLLYHWYFCPQCIHLFIKVEYNKRNCWNTCLLICFCEFKAVLTFHIISKIAAWAHRIEIYGNLYQMHKTSTFCVTNGTLKIWDHLHNISYTCLHINVMKICESIKEWLNFNIIFCFHSIEPPCSAENIINCVVKSLNLPIFRKILVKVKGLILSFKLPFLFMTLAVQNWLQIWVVFP